MAEPVFNPEGCDVQFVSAIEPIPDIGDCSIPEAPLPLHDCVDQSISMPVEGPPGTAGVGIPDITGLDPEIIYDLQLINNIAIWQIHVGLPSVELLNPVFNYQLITVNNIPTWVQVSAGSEDSTAVLITEDIAPSEWDQEIRLLTPTSCTFPKWTPTGGGYTYDEEVTLNFESWMRSGVTIPAGCKGKIGLVQGGKLMNADCVVLDIDCI